MNKAASKLGLNQLKNAKSTSSLKRGLKKGSIVRGYSSNKDKAKSPVSFQIPKMGMMIATNNIHQNICIFPEESRLKKEKMIKAHVTEPAFKLVLSL